MANGEAYYVTSERQYLCDKGNMARRQWHRLFNFFFKNRLLGMKDNFRAYFLILVLPSYLLSDCYCDLKASHKCDFDSGDRRRLLQLLRFCCFGGGSYMDISLYSRIGFRASLLLHFSAISGIPSAENTIAGLLCFQPEAEAYCSLTVCNNCIWQEQKRKKKIVDPVPVGLVYGFSCKLIWTPWLILRIIMLAEVVCDASFMTLYWYQDGGRLSDQLMALLQYQQENIHFLSEEILGLQESLSK
ncbi:uncharacterized protein LOC124885635 isoform X3 [Capsicum annuum]|uniref:uncharacterized protein LOC124885635 isoform X3 n=1 Tax=Capsicum annuum TaxID=4072 RepID=UPI001FB053A0|nr:uncharacterized protein LOC124885635 isoform X3 [Capsicum annuum]